MKILTSLILLLITTITVNAQKPPHFLTIQAGFTKAFWSETADTPNDEYTFKSKLAPTFGIGFFNELGPKFGISGGVYYQRLNATRFERCLNCEVTVEKESEFKLNYIDIPVNINYFIKNDQQDVYVIGGIGLRLALSGQHLWRQDVSTQEIDKFKLKEDMRKSTFMANIGMGYKYQLTYTTTFATEATFGFHPGSTLKTEQFGLNALNLKFGLYFRLN